MKNLLRPLCVWLLVCLAQRASAQTPILNSYPTASSVIFLDFDGQTVDGTSWNWFGPIVCGPSGMTSAQITEIFHRVSEDYRPFNVNVTTDSTVFLAAPAKQRMRVILTVSSSWYGSAGGVAFTTSFNWGDDTPCFVFSALLGYNTKNVAEAASHEAGHTLGLSHQSQYDAACNKLTDYYAGQGSGEIGWAPIMGVGYYQNFTLWNYGPNSYGCSNYQSDLDIITSGANGFSYRADDQANNFASASVPVFSANQFNVTGVIERNTDQDYFKFIMPSAGQFQLDAIPYNVGSGNAGSDLDMQVTLFNGAETAVSVYNPGALLNSVIDTTLDAGTYYLRVEGKGNQYAPAYASLGSYSMQASINITNTVLPLHRIELRGAANGNRTQLSWTIDADEAVAEQVLEAATDGRHFNVLASATADVRSYAYRPETTATVQYRVNVLFADGHRYYSNIFTIRDNNADPRPKLVSNLINANTIYVSSPGKYRYQVVDMNGKTIAIGNLNSGINSIGINGLMSGMYMVRFENDTQQWSDKLLRQ